MVFWGKRSEIEVQDPHSGEMRPCPQSRRLIRRPSIMGFTSGVWQMFITSSWLAGEGSWYIILLFSRVWHFATQWTAACQASLSFTVSWSSLKSCPLCQWCHRTISSSVSTFCSCPQSFPASEFFPVSILFVSGGQSIGASASSPSNEYSRLISFRIDWFDLLAVQGTLKNLL